MSCLQAWQLSSADVISLETGGGSGDAGVPGRLRRREARGAGGEAAPAPEAQVSQSNR